MTNDQPPLPLCLHCRQPMNLLRRLEIVPEICFFYCARCKHAEIKVHEQAASEAQERAA